MKEETKVVPNTFEEATTLPNKALTKSTMEQWTTRRGEMMKEIRKKASLAVGSAGMK